MHLEFEITRCITYNAYVDAIITLADIAPLFKQARQKAGLSQTQLAEPLGMSRATISAIERGRCEEIGFAKLVGLLERVGLEITVAPRKGRLTIDDLRAQRRSP
jgi:DNA-binding XRE family transcriptional regulator